MTIKKNLILIVVYFAMLAPLAERARAGEAAKDTTRAQRLGIYPFPLIYYTPETGFAIGAAALYLYRDSLARPLSRTSDFTADMTYTLKKQIIAEVNTDYYFFENDEYRVAANTSFKNFPNKFYGIGNNVPADSEESYTSRSFLLQIILYKKIKSNLNLGPLLRFESTSIVETDPSGALTRGFIPGSKGGFVSGLGLSVNWDSRDNAQATQSGGLYQVTSILNMRGIGSDFSYNDVQLDVRHFYELIPAQILAVQAEAEIIGGTAPFQNLARFGGENLVRGYFDGQYRDNTSLVFQADYRIPVWWKLGVVAFAGIGQVAGRVGEWSTREFKIAGGGGIRYILDAEEHVTLRVDLGFGENSSGVYFTSSEAF